MLSSQIEQEERKRTLDNDRKVREGGTFLAHALADAELPRGRFSAIANAQVVGAQPIPNYPAAAAHQADPCGPEPALGFEIDAMPELGPSLLATVAQAPDGPADAPSTSVSPSMSEPAGSSLSQSGDTAGDNIPSPPDTSDVEAVLPVLKRRRL